MTIVSAIAVTSANGTEFCKSTSRILGNATQFSANVTAHGKAIYELPLAIAEKSPESFELTVGALQDLNAGLIDIAATAASMSAKDAQDTFIALFDRVVYSDSFGANLYWVAKADPSKIDIAKMDANLENAIQALGDRLQKDPSVGGDDLVQTFVTDFVVDGFSYARLPDRISQVIELIAIRKLTRALTPQERAVSKVLGWDKERKDKRSQLQELLEI